MPRVTPAPKALTPPLRKTKSEPQLIEVPRLERLTRTEIENRLTIVRAKRLTATVVYHEGRNTKLKHEAAVLDRRIDQQLDLLERELDRLDQLASKIEKRADQIEVMRHNATLANDMIVILDKTED